MRRVKTVAPPPPLHAERTLLVRVKLPADWSAEESTRAVQEAVSRLQEVTYFTCPAELRPEPATVEPAAG